MNCFRESKNKITFCVRFDYDHLFETSLDILKEKILPIFFFFFLELIEVIIFTNTYKDGNI